MSLTFHLVHVAAAFVFTTAFSSAAVAGQAAAPAGPVGQEASSYLNLQPRRRMPQPALLGATQPEPQADARGTEGSHGAGARHRVRYHDPVGRRRH